MKIIASGILAIVLLAGASASLAADESAAAKAGPVYTLAMEGMT